MKNIIIGIIVIVVLVVGGIFLFGGSSDEISEGTNIPSTENNVLETEQPTGDVITPEAPTSETTREIMVVYGNNGFSPQSVDIKVGNVVLFVNKGGPDMWVGSNPHPTHTLYDGTTLNDHCFGSSGTPFDQCSTGSSYSFTFEKAGSFPYHNHLRPSDGGVIIVK